MTLFTNRKPTLTKAQSAKLLSYDIKIVENEINELEHINGYIQNIILKDGSKIGVKAIYTRLFFKQHCLIFEQLRSELTEDGYIIIVTFQKTTVNGVYACGDNVTRMRTVVNAVAMGTAAGMNVKNLLRKVSK